MLPFARHPSTHPSGDPSGDLLAGELLAGRRSALCRVWHKLFRPRLFRPKLIGTKLIRTTILPVTTVMVLALGGCGTSTQKTAHLDDSVHHGSGNTGAVAASASAEQPSGEQPAGAQTGTILFMAAPEGGKPARLISRTNSITTAPTAKHLLRQALASGRRAPANTTNHTAPLVIEADDHQETPIQLPAPTTTAPRTDSQITIRHQPQRAGQPTILKIIEAP